jgi:hypothetical protein
VNKNRHLYFKPSQDIHDTNPNPKMQVKYLSLCPAAVSENTTTAKKKQNPWLSFQPNHISMFHLMLHPCRKLMTEQENQQV